MTKQKTTSSNRRPSQDKVSSTKESNRHTEAPGEGPEATASADTKILVGGGSSGTSMGIDTPDTSGMGLKDGDNDGPREEGAGPAKDSRNQHGETAPLARNLKFEEFN
jgi:hypothetical protein